jgi:hypothetical protein
MANPNRFKLLGILSVSVGLLAAVTFSFAQQSNPSTQQVADLQEQLEKGLRARRPIEVQFLSRVIQLVNQGRLTREVVQGTFSFVLKKYRDRKYLVPIFEQTLRKRLSLDGNTALDNVPTTLTLIQ